MRSGVSGPFQQPGSWNMEATRHSTAPLREAAAAVLPVTDGDSGLDLHRSFVRSRSNSDCGSDCCSNDA